MKQFFKRLIKTVQVNFFFDKIKSLFLYKIGMPAFLYFDFESKKNHGQKRLFKRIEMATYLLKAESLELIEFGEDVSGFFDIDTNDQAVMPNKRNLDAWLDSLDKQRVKEFFCSVNIDKEYELKYKIKTFKGHEKWVLDKGVKREGRDGSLCFGVWKDITELELIKQSLDFLSKKDPLTGLLNRFSFNDIFEDWVEKHRQTGKPFALFRMQIDNYRHIKDTLGVKYIDQFDQCYSLKLKKILGSAVVLSKQGPGLYSVLMPLNTVDDGDTVVDYCSLIQQDALIPVKIKLYRLRVSISFGISMSPKYAVESCELISQADIALQKAIKSGGNHYVFFSEKMHESVRFKTMVENELLEALENNQLYLEFQPQVDMLTGRILAAEALVRWWHPVHGLIKPDDFINIAETTGLIKELGMWVFTQACKIRSSWIGQAHSEMVMAVNVSPLQLDEKFVEFVHHTLMQCQLPSSCIEIEVTENHLMENYSDRIGNLRALSQMGLPLAIDDFGTGYSSLCCLKQLPLKKIKIDKSFVKDITVIENSDCNSIIKAILAIGNSLGMRVLAEGIESEFQKRFLKEQGCHAYQGFLFSPPLSSKDMIKLCSEQELNQPIKGLQASH